MNNTARIKKNIRFIKLQKLVIVAVLIGFLSAFLGLFIALLLNTYLNANIIPVNFMVIGMAAVLSASIHAPFTAIFLICGLTNDYTLFVPILAVCLISKYTAKMIYPYSVYSYSTTLSK